MFVEMWMSLSVNELYKALIEAGVSEEKAEAAAKAVISREEANFQLASKTDLANLKTDIIKWNTGTLLAATGLFALIVKLIG